MLEDSSQGVGHRIAAEGPPPRQHFEEDASEGPDVGALVDREPSRLFGAHVGRRTQDAAVRRLVIGDRQLGRRDLAGIDRRPGESEVEHLDPRVARDTAP